MQRVFGMSQRLPSSLLSDAIIDPSYLGENTMSDFERSENPRQAATRAWAALDNRARPLKSFRGRHRVPQTFQEGDTIFVWRQPKLGPGKWTGPGVVVLPTSGGAWVNMRGSLWRCSNEQLRNATSEECRGAELVNQYLGSMKTDLMKNRGARRYVDVRREGAPRFPGEPQVDDEGEELMADDSEVNETGDAEEPEGESVNPRIEELSPSTGGHSR